MFSLILYLFLLLPSTSSEILQSDVVIVGAGAAGLAAASKLNSFGLNVIVLEAEGTIGGRIKSVHFGDAYVELGAEWCHGEDGNIVYEIVKSLEILKHSNYNSKLYFSNKYEIDDDFNNQLHEICDNIYSGDGETYQDPEISTGHYFIRNFNHTVKEIWAQDLEKQQIALMCLETFNHYVLADEGCFNWFDNPATSDFRNSPGDLQMNWNGQGYKTILDMILGKSFPMNTIHLNKVVRNIYYNEDHVMVICQDGTMYLGTYLVSTMSVGVLKHNPFMFMPPLDSAKVFAIDSIGFDGVHKVLAWFPEIWWDTQNFSGFSFVWSYEDREMLPAEYPRGPCKGGRHWLNDIYRVYRTENNPNILSFWFTGQMVPDIEEISDEELINGLEFVLVKFLGHKYSIRKPARILREKWYSHPHFRGVYSYQTFQSRRTNISSNVILGEPIFKSPGKPIVLFAGEATHPSHFGTVHGAIETGFREANRIIGIFNEEKNRTQFYV